MAPAIKARPSRSSPMQGTDFGNSLRSTARPQPTFYDSVANPVAQHDNDHAHFRDIEILPTTDEILAVGRPIFMPKKDDGSPNPISPGPERFLDLQFRHLRFESTESIKDICYSAAQSAFLNPNRIANDHYADTHAQNSLISAPQQPCNPHVMIRKDTPSGNPYFLYQNTRVEELEAHERHGVLVRLSYDCPTFMRGRIFADTGRLEQGMLLSLLCHDRTKNELSTHFLSIHMAQSTMSMEPRSGKGRRAAVQAAFLPGATKEDAIEFARLAQHLEPDIEMVMVEFPKMLPTGFCSPLRRLQEMSGFAFDQYLAPKRDLESIKVTRQLKLSGHAVSHLVCQRPEYSSARDFEYDLSSILLNVDNNAKTTFTVDELSYQSTIDNLLTSSTLDEGQIHALTHSLRNEFAFTQGPPGTGKTYLGIQLTRVLLDSRPGKPILVVCLTNHALDSFLAGLRDEGIKNLLRIGNGSKEDWTQAFNLREKTRKARLTPNEQQVKRRLRERRNTLFANIHDWCRSASSQSLTGRAGWYAVDKLLAATEPVLHRQLKLTDNRASQKFLFDHWVEGGDLKALRQLRDRLISSHQGGDHSKSSPGPGPDEVLESVCKAAEVLVPQTGAKSVWQMTPDERRATLDKWHTDIDPEQLAMCLANDFADYQATKAGLEAVRDSLDVRVLSQASVIGITTTGCASRWEILKALGIEVVICEEAGEVMEPHALCALLPSLQHAIFIGDPLQLRPEVSEQRLTLERSHDYRLNESLFERMITPLDPSASGLSFAQLTIQRRMHPAIADIARLIYPSLRDHESTRSREATIGVEPRIFWWDHRVPELSETSNTKSHINEHEVNMVAGLVQYLLKGSGYRPGDIAVLTPYSGQLAEFYKALNKTCKVWLNEEDRKLLLKEEQLDIEPTELRKKDEVKMSDLLRITTVDNFQGEEAAVVILSTVRSGTRPGFLKSENRINVACSRARNGFYIIGNSLTLSSVPMWRGVLDVFGSRRGTSLMTYCNNHPEYRFSVKELDNLNLQGVYKVDESGTIAGYGIGPFTNLHEPTCTCGRLCPSVHRYSVIHKLVGIDAVMKRLFETIIGGKVCSFAAQVSRVENDLRKSLEAWKSGVRPEAIASAMNSRKIQERADELLELKGKIAEYNDKFVVPVEKAITQLRYAMPSVFPYLPTAHLRLGVIILRLSSVMVGDNIAMAQYLSTLPDPALMTQRMSEVLLQATVNGAEASRKQCIKLLEDEALKKVPALACELQLRQIQLWLLVDCGLEAMPSETLLAENINAPIDHKLEDIPDMLDILDAVLDSSKRYPQTCSSFSSATTNFKHLLGNIIEGQSVGTVPGIDITSARKVERRFREYVGAKRITVCAENHPYFEDVFGKNGCPDCGKKVELDEEVFRHSGKFLFENDFLAAIETMSLHSAPQTSPMLSEGGNFTSTNVARVAEVHANGTASAPVTSSNAAAALVTEDSADACSDATTEVLDDNQATPAKATVSNGQGKSSKPGGTDEDAFLQAMVGQGWSFKSENDEAGGRSLPRAQKTPEERFLESMKRLMADKENAK
ncbi:uncharacterized protein HMPREF1541_07624 [Cyphellophora europaea CBS 101466]|uniref:DNA2/NAM7 helicase-like C-terminal domain-containing protein n=1 Tax=Cyphellophora europaea (strain CBS 101466) TaxID=1220924 RepID=W2RNC3_CYPE1|nr:uncharacterized protein HMPREF1541_07624 [Cyphellophora europaea CBS 101466]ETN38001.1 hypothetical protein HMPREF1541_07624 [Cyphellophora europaea CBS 101466]